eukprot:2457911-Rhodomonas_salina.2
MIVGSGSILSIRAAGEGHAGPAADAPHGALATEDRDPLAQAAQGHAPPPPAGSRACRARFARPPARLHTASTCAGCSCSSCRSLASARPVAEPRLALARRASAAANLSQ